MDRWFDGRLYTEQDLYRRLKLSYVHVEHLHEVVHIDDVELNTLFEYYLFEHKKKNIFKFVVFAL